MGCLLCEGAGFREVVALRGFHIQTCVSCGLTQLYPLPAADTLAALYDDDYYDAGGDKGYNRYVAHEAEYRATFLDDLRRIEGQFPEGKKLRILDVGCGPGAFLAAALERGHDAVGVDIIESIVEDANRRFPGRVFCGRMEDVPDFAAEPFDVVFASHVIEHIATPIAFTRLCTALLRDNGILVYVTPNIRSWLARLSGRRWVSFKVPEHVTYYNPETIGDLFSRSGLQLAAVDSAYEFHNVEFLAERVRKLIRPLDRVVPHIEKTAALRGRVVKVTSGSMRAIGRDSRNG